MDWRNLQSPLISDEEQTSQLKDSTSNSQLMQSKNSELVQSKSSELMQSKKASQVRA